MDESLGLWLGELVCGRVLNNQVIVSREMGGVDGAYSRIIAVKGQEGAGYEEEGLQIW